MDNPSTGPSSVEVARNALWRMLEVMGSELLAFGFMVFLARLLLPEDYGVVAIATVFLMVAQMAVYHGFAEALIQQVELDEAAAASALWTNIVFAGAMALAIFLAAGWIAEALDKPALGPILRGLSPAILMFGFTGIYQARVRRELRIVGLAIRTLVSVIAGGSVGVVMAFNGGGAWSLVGQQLTHATAGVLVLIWFTGWLPKPQIDMAKVLGMLRYGGHVMVTYLVDMITRNIATLILGYFLLAEMVGHFFIANRLFLSLAMLTFISVNELILPILARMQGSAQAHREGIYRGFRIMALVCLPSYLGLAILAEPIILTLFGEKWAGAIEPLFILCLFGIATGLTTLVAQIFMSINRPERAAELTLVTCGLLLALVIPAASQGLMLATIAIGAAFALTMPYAAWRLHQVMPSLEFRRVAREQLPVWLASLAMVAVIELALHTFLAGQSPAVCLTVAVPLGVVVFVALLRVLAPAFFLELVTSLRGAFLHERAG